MSRQPAFLSEVYVKFAISREAGVTCITCLAGNSGKISLQQTQSVKQTLVSSGTTHSDPLKNISGFCKKNQSSVSVPAAGCRQAAAADPGWFPQWWDQHPWEGQRWAGRDSELTAIPCSPNQQVGHLERRDGHWLLYTIKGKTEQRLIRPDSILIWMRF